MKLSYTVTLDDKLHGGEVFTRHQSGWHQLALLWFMKNGAPVCAVFAWAGFVARTMWPGSHNFSFDDLVARNLFIGAVLASALTFALKRAQRQIRLSIGKGPFSTSAELADDAFIIREGTSEVRCKWSGLEFLLDEDDGLGIFFPPHGRYWIPNTAFTDDTERANWKTFIQARVADAERLRGNA